jgi:hypothetical protein
LFNDRLTHSTRLQEQVLVPHWAIEHEYRPSASGDPA